MPLELAILLANIAAFAALHLWLRHCTSRFRRKPAPSETSTAPHWPDIRRFAGTARRRQRVQRIWARKKGSRSIGVLDRLLSDPTEASVLRYDCAFLLFPVWPAIESQVIRILGARDEDSWLITKLIDLLGRHGTERSVAPLLAALRSDDLQIALAAEGALRRLAAERPSQPELREAVIHGLVLSIRNSRRPWGYQNQLRILVELDNAHLPFPPAPETVDMLIKVMNQQPLDNDYAVKTAAFAAEALGELGASVALPELERLIHVDCDLLRYKVVTALGRLGSRRIVSEIGYLAAKDQIGRIKRRAVDAALEIYSREPAPSPILPR